MDIFFVFLLLFSEIILLGIAWYAFKGDFISPSIVTLVLFILSTACFAYNTSDWTVVFTFKAYSLFFISFCLMIFVEKWISKHRIKFGNAYFNSNSIQNTKEILSIRKPFEMILFVFFLACALFYIYKVYKTGISLGATSLLASIGVNKEEGDFDGVSRLAYNLVRIASYVYTVIFCNNVFYCKQKISKNIKSLIIVLLTLMITFFSGQRSSSICYLAGIVVAAGIFIGDNRKPNSTKDMKKYLKKIVVLATAVVALFFASSNIVKGTSIERKFIDYMTYYFGSTTALMGKIVENPDLCHTPFAGYFGEKTFNGFWNNLYSWGLVSEQPCERMWIKMGGSIATSAGNEYTFFCGPYIDFGFFGALIFVILFYAIFAHIYYWKIKKAPNGMRRYTMIAIYIFLFAMVAMSFYQDTIRSYSRPINIFYILYIIVFCKLFIKTRRVE